MKIPCAAEHKAESGKLEKEHLPSADTKADTYPKPFSIPLKNALQ